MKISHYSFMMKHCRETGNKQLEEEIAYRFLSELTPPPKKKTTDRGVKARLFEALK